MAEKERKTPEIGAVFRHRYMGVVYEMKVVETQEGIGYEMGGIVYKSPTAAAKALVGKNQPTNGRAFWHMDK